MKPDKDATPIKVTDAMLQAGLEMGFSYNEDLQPGVIPERALAAVYIAMRRLEASCATSTKGRNAFCPSGRKAKKSRKS